MAKTITHLYSLEVYNSKTNQYVEWGVPHSTKKQCIDAVNSHAQECLNIYLKYKDDPTAAPHAEYWYQEYKDLTQHAVILYDKECVTEIKTTKSSINILEEKENG